MRAVLTSDAPQERPHHASCLVNARLGWQLRVAVRDEFVQSQVCKTEQEVRTSANSAARPAEAKRWSYGLACPRAHANGICQIVPVLRRR